MKAALYSIPKSEKETLEKMLEKYRQELLGVDNPDKYKYLGSYWQNEDNRPFFVTINDRIVGFILVNKHSLQINSANSIAEFYILPAYRRNGIGKEAAANILREFPGLWEVRVLNDNIGAIKFWRNLINELTHGNFTEIFSNSSKWNGPIFLFSIK